jgi:beta-lactamase class D
MAGMAEVYARAPAAPQQATSAGAAGRHIPVRNVVQVASRSSSRFEIVMLRLTAGLLLLALPLTVQPAASTSLCTVVAEASSGAVLHRDGPCEVRQSPMSTFKVPLALMGADSGFLTGPKTPSIAYRQEFRAVERDRKTVDPTIWLRDSVVWYSQQITKKLGPYSFRRYIDAFDYGNRDLSGNPGKNDGLTQAWLMASLEISPDEQVQFVRKFLAREFPVSADAYDLTMDIIPMFPAADGWTVHGKTGSGLLRDARGAPDRKKPLGWFVGWAENGDRRVVFARLRIDDAPSEAPLSFRVRDSLIADLPGLVAGASSAPR